MKIDSFSFSKVDVKNYLSGERSSAAAGVFCIWIVKRKSAIVEPFHPVNFDAQ